MDNFYEEEELETDIQSILDDGYDLLNEFQIWLEKSLNIDSDTSQQECYNAESLLEYLAYRARRHAPQIDEFHLRWFVFSHFIRNSIAGKETEEKLLDSLKHLYQFLYLKQGFMQPDWMSATLEDSAFYLDRRAAYREMNSEDEREWQDQYRDWCEELEQDLDARCLLMPRNLTESLRWGDKMGWREATLYEEANNNWQKGRVELLLDGLDYDAIRYDLTTAYESWLENPQSRLDDETPLMVIFDERAVTETHNEHQNDDED